MAPFTALLLAWTGGCLAARYTLTETYDASNFADNFNFFTDPDPNGGFVSYQSRQQAQAQGLYAIRNNQVYLGVDHSTKLSTESSGRPSVRLESTSTFRHGLIVARFAHLPSNRCGSWPAFWAVGPDWPNGGEMDMYEGWNDASRNQPALHTGDSSDLGSCTLSGAGQTSSVLTENCDNTYSDPPQQYAGTGCTSAEDGPWASSSGGTYAVEWTSEAVKFYAFARGSEPGSLSSQNVDTASWGTPSVNLRRADCDVDAHFQEQRLVLDIAFCGNPAGNEEIWNQSCAARTEARTCVDHVARSPGDFKEVYFLIQDIRYFERVQAEEEEPEVETGEPETPVYNWWGFGWRLRR